MKKYSIRRYVALLTLTPLLVMAISLETFFLHDRFSDMDRDLIERGQLISGQLAANAEYGVFSDNRAFLEMLVQGVAQQPDVQGVMILDGASAVVAETGKFASLPEDSVAKSVNAQQPVLRAGETLRLYRPVLATQVMLEELDSHPAAQQIGAVILEMSGARTSLLKRQFLWGTIASTLLFLVFPFAMVSLFSRSIVRPVTRLSEAVSALGEGRLDVRLTEDNCGVSELENLARGVNDMAAKLQQRMDEADRLAAIAFESHEGMMVVNAALTIIRTNRALSRITGYPEEEIVGQTPRLFSSGRHDSNFFAAMWDSLNTNGLWQGEIWNRRKSGEIYPAWVNITAVEREDSDVAYYVATYADITLRKAAEDEIRNLAFNDALTQLPNRRTLVERLNLTLVASKRSGRYGALMFIDLDNFKPLNDLFGHEVGDLLLIEVARRLTACVRETDSVARFGGDEFVVMLGVLDAERDASIVQAGIIAEKIRTALAEPYVLTVCKEGKTATTVEHQCTSSIGVRLFSGHETDAEEILGHADMAMYRAKRGGRNSICFCDES